MKGQGGGETEEEGIEEELAQCPTTAANGEYTISGSGERGIHRRIRVAVHGRTQLRHPVLQRQVRIYRSAVGDGHRRRHRLGDRREARRRRSDRRQGDGCLDGCGDRAGDRVCVWLQPRKRRMCVHQRQRRIHDRGTGGRRIQGRVRRPAAVCGAVLQRQGGALGSGCGVGDNWEHHLGDRRRACAKTPRAAPEHDISHCAWNHHGTRQIDRAANRGSRSPRWGCSGRDVRGWCTSS